MNRDLMFSSKSDEWSTPGDIYEALNREFKFNLDPCATDENHKCEKYYTVEDDGLAKNWGGTEYSAILRTHALKTGFGRLARKPRRTGRWSFC